MKITVSLMGRFTAFDLARELHEAGFLQRLITTHPKSATRKYGLPKSKVCSFWPIEAVSRLWLRSPQWLQKSFDPRVLTNRLFDGLASRCIPEETDIFVGWSSFCLESLREARRRGAITVVDEGSSHILTRTEIVRQEYERHGLRPRLSHPKIVEKEMKEYEETDYVAIPSSFVKRSFLERGFSEEKLIEAPYGVDPEEFAPVPKRDRVFRVIYCGAISLRKGVHYLLKAFHELRLSNAQMWLIGGLSEEMIPFLRKYGDGKVFRKGPYPQAELHQHYSQGSVFALPSVEDGFGLVLLQAMACGLPVIGTINTAAPDIIRDGHEGFIVPIRDVEALKEKLLFLHEDAVRCKTMGEAARIRVLEAFTWRAYGDRVMQGYQRILRNSRLTGAGRH